MISTEHDFYLLVREGMTSGIDTTTLDDDTSRHGVLHGRVLGFGTRRRAAQAFAFLATSLELLVASYEVVPVTDEENRAKHADMTLGMEFILSAKAYLPVRTIYLTMGRDRGQDVLVTVDDPGPQPPSPDGDEP
jgi:hypothetical protein